MSTVNGWLMSVAEVRLAYWTALLVLVAPLVNMFITPVGSLESAAVRVAVLSERVPSASLMVMPRLLKLLSVLGSPGTAPVSAWVMALRLARRSESEISGPPVLVEEL